MPPRKFLRSCQNNTHCTNQSMKEYNKIKQNKT